MSDIEESSEHEIFTQVKITRSPKDDSLEDGQGQVSSTPVLELEKIDKCQRGAYYLDDPDPRERRGDVRHLGLNMETRGTEDLPTGGMKKRPIVKLEQYSGEEDWEEFVSHFELCSEIGAWSRRDRRLALAASLKGAARTFYNNLDVLDRVSYNTLITRLNERFGNTRQQSKWLTKFESKKREPGESIDIVGDQLRQMSQRAYPELGLRAREALALNQLYKSVSPELKYRCMDKECKTVVEAVDVISRYEAILGRDDDKDKKKSTVRATNDLGLNKNATNDSLAQQILQRIEVLERDLDRRSYYANRNQGRPRGCFRCGQEDHYIRDCPQPMYRENEAPNQRFNNTRNNRPPPARPQNPRPSGSGAPTGNTQPLSP
jgi:hypothetical protein